MIFYKLFSKMPSIKNLRHLFLFIIFFSFQIVDGRKCESIAPNPGIKEWRFNLISQDYNHYPIYGKTYCLPNCRGVYSEPLHKEIRRTIFHNGSTFNLLDSLKESIGYSLRGNESVTVNTNSQKYLPFQFNFCIYDSLIDTSISFEKDSLFIRFVPGSKKVKVLFSKSEGLLYFESSFKDSILLDSSYSQDIRIEDSISLKKINFTRVLFPDITGVIQKNQNRLRKPICIFNNSFYGYGESVYNLLGRLNGRSNRFPKNK